MPEDSQDGPKDELLQVRLDSGLAADVRQKSRRYGGASAVVRALLRRWVKEDIISADDVLAEVGRVDQQTRRKPDKPRK